MDKNERAKIQLQKAISNFVTMAIKNAPFDKTYTAYIKKVNIDKTYDVSLNGVVYENVRTMSGMLEKELFVNESVRVLVPQNNMNNMFILK